MVFVVETIRTYVILFFFIMVKTVTVIIKNKKQKTKLYCRSRLLSSSVL